MSNSEKSDNVPRSSRLKYIILGFITGICTAILVYYNSNFKDIVAYSISQPNSLSNQDSNSNIWDLTKEYFYDDNELQNLNDDEGNFWEDDQLVKKDDSSKKDETTKKKDETTKKSSSSKKDSSSTSSSSDSSSSESSSPTPIYNQAGVRFVFVLAGIVILNMVAIVLHHIFLKLSSSERNYRSVEREISPY